LRRQREETIVVTKPGHRERSEVRTSVSSVFTTVVTQHSPPNPMATAVRPSEKKKGSSAERPPFKVADLSLAEWGRKEIRLAEQEMPGLMAVRDEYKGKFPLKG